MNGNSLLALVACVLALALVASASSKAEVETQVTLFKDGSPLFYVMEHKKSDDKLKLLKAELPRLMHHEIWDTVRYFNGTIVKSSDEIVSGSSYVITAGDNFFWEPISNKNIHKVVLDREVSLATVELKPKVFHVQNLLSKEEAEYIFLMAKAKAKKSMDDNRARTKVVFESGLPYLFGDAIFDRVFQRVMNLTHSHNTIVEPEIWFHGDNNLYPKQLNLEEDHRRFGHRDGRRLGTLIVSLNSIPAGAGGDIVFPHTSSQFFLSQKTDASYLEKVCDGSAVANAKPTRFNSFSPRGQGLLMYNIVENEHLYSDPWPEERGEYLHCPLKGEDKWVLVFSWYNKPVKHYNPQTTRIFRAFTDFNPANLGLSTEFYHVLHTGDLVHVIDESGMNGWWDGIINGVRKFFPGNHVLPVVAAAIEDTPAASKDAQDQKPTFRLPEEYSNYEVKEREEFLKLIEQRAREAEAQAAKAAENPAQEEAAPTKKAEELKDEL